MAKGKVEITGLNTNNLKSLSHEENMELFKKMQEGDSTAKEKLVKGNLKLVLSIIKRFSNKVENLDDLFQVGVIGLIKAIDNFDMSYNLKLSTYACPLIIGECKRSIRDSTSLRVSRSIKDLAYQIIRFKDDYAKEHAAFPSNEIIAKNLNIEEYEITYALDALREPSSFYEPVYNEGGDTIYLLDQIADKNNIEKLGNKALLEENINIRASDYRFADKAKYYKGFFNDKGIYKEGTKDNELIKMATEYSDYTEQNILNRTEQIYTEFIRFVKKQNLFKG